MQCILEQEAFSKYVSMIIETGIAVLSKVFLLVVVVVVSLSLPHLYTSIMRVCRMIGSREWATQQQQTKRWRHGRVNRRVLPTLGVLVHI